jgi:hypothetical protein
MSAGISDAAAEWFMWLACCAALHYLSNCLHHMQLAGSDADARRRRAQLFGSSQADEVEALVSE